MMGLVFASPALAQVGGAGGQVGGAGGQVGGAGGQVGGAGGQGGGAGGQVGGAGGQVGGAGGQVGGAGGQVVGAGGQVGADGRSGGEPLIIRRSELIAPAERPKTSMDGLMAIGVAQGPAAEVTAIVTSLTWLAVTRKN
jgi:hypothetical protein